VRGTRILLADDHPLLLEGLKKLLEDDYDLVGTVNDGKSLIGAARTLRPDVIILDISMPGLNGLEAAKQIHKSNPEIKLIVLSVHSDTAYVEEAFRLGAQGYILKRSVARELLTALKEVIGGRRYLTSVLGTQSLRSRLARSKASNRLQPLTLRQMDVLKLVAEGRQNKEIAIALSISVKTVEYHKTCIMNELDIHTPAGLTRYAIDRGILAS
jgi:DNA-binding NarL/FixJ family response regulator